jgi:hypothetical protein
VLIRGIVDGDCGTLHGCIGHRVMDEMLASEQQHYRLSARSVRIIPEGWLHNRAFCEQTEVTAGGERQLLLAASRPGKGIRGSNRTSLAERRAPRMSGPRYAGMRSGAAQFLDGPFLASCQPRHGLSQRQPQ